MTEIVTVNDGAYDRAFKVDYLMPENNHERKYMGKKVTPLSCIVYGTSYYRRLYYSRDEQQVYIVFKGKLVPATIAYLDEGRPRY